jgi:hypothetical protein
MEPDPKDKAPAPAANKAHVPLTSKRPLPQTPLRRQHLLADAVKVVAPGPVADAAADVAAVAVVNAESFINSHKGHPL